MSKITISCTNVKCYNYGVPIKIEKEDPEYFKDGSYVCPTCGQVIEVEEKSAMDPMTKKRILLGLGAVIVIAGIACGVIFGVKAIRKKAAYTAEVERLEALAKACQDSIDAVNAAETARLAAEQQAAEEAARLEAEALAAAEAARLAEEEAAKAKKAEKATPSKPAASGRISYGKWSGSWKGGLPHGNGTMRYTEEHLIDSRDPQKRVATPGDYIIGEFANGKLVQGVWYDSSNNVKGSIIIGM